MSISLGTASTYAVLAATTVANTGPSILTGDVGISPGNTITGFPPGTYSGTLNTDNSVSIIAQSDLTTAYNACSSATTTYILSGSTYNTTNLEQLSAGVYSIGLGLTINGTLILNGSSTDQFIFQIGSTLTTTVNSVIQLSGGVTASNIFWQVGSSAILGTSSIFNGHILALTSITANYGAVINGSLLSTNDAIFLNTNTVTDTDTIVCYLKGTKILTKNGYKNIEDMILGDEVSIFGNIKDEREIINNSNGVNTLKVIFIGTFSRSNLTSHSKPIIIKSGSFSENIPFEDIGISPFHRIIVNNSLFQAIYLINNNNIYQSEDYETVTYYHFELETHSIVKANGLLCESLIGNQDKFTPV